MKFVRNLFFINKRFISNVPFAKRSDKLEEIYNEFSNYRGGSIDLIKDSKSGTAFICLNHPELKNAISGSMMTKMSDIITELEQWKEGKSVLIYGANKFFCSGGDLNTVRQIADSDGGRRMSLLMQYNFIRLQSLPMITYALIEGMALGGGAELLTACDYRIMTENAKIGYVHTRIGITLAWGGGSRLTQLIGPNKALDLIVTGRILTAKEALNIGLVEHVIESNDNVLNQTEQLINERHKHLSVDNVKASKGIVNAAKCLPLELALQKEIDYFASVWGGHSHLLALTNNIKHRK